MISTLKKTFTKNQETNPSFKVNFSDPAHHWINQNQRIKRFFEDVISQLSEEEKDSLATYGELVFLESQGMHSSVIPSHGDKTFVLVYPQLKKAILTADNEEAYAIIFHELGHLYYRHFTMRLHANEMTKQIEADDFAIRHGFGKGLFNFLMKMPISHEVSQRLEMIRLRT
ncbi:hypothetical protein DAY19_13740 [Halobacteriovorax vibrionivorans]|uniref:Peptidase M48 domain-containing protein n=1 Tax=Halobacteriovorax vibrionivorans TaxID=2152716 RepID=A0ABY0II72_9BACT|nr:MULTISPECIES: hypothetical protein [Halobacteriovorax]RZF21037.1 hypothetical protein DAY19_13740 [Halobacteriovorax vibrionivorans]TGD48051.1 hypothetical protein EP118_05350 [Halobacteriovorax sp. Y22]